MICILLGSPSIVLGPYDVPDAVLGKPLAEVEAKYGPPLPETWLGEGWDYTFHISDEMFTSYFLLVDTGDDATVSRAKTTYLSEVF